MKNETHLIPNADSPQGSLPVAKMLAYEVPAGYFEDLAEDILTKIRVEEVTAKWPQTMPYAVPENYFTDSAKAIHDAAIQIPTREMPYQVPAAYFDTLSENIHAQVQQISVWHVSSRRIWKPLSIAATVLILLGLAWGFLMSGSPKQNPAVSPENQLAALSDVEIDGYVQSHLTEIDRTIRFVVPDIKGSDCPQWDNEILEHSLNALSDEELKAYSL